MAKSHGRDQNHAKLFSVEEAAVITGGSFRGSASITFCGAAIDSRQVEEGFLFAALQGERVDGHDFIAQAVTMGASVLLVSKYVVKKESFIDVIDHYESNGQAFLIVDNTLLALQQLAKAHLAQFTDLIKIGVTGSSGKTTTKEILGAILKQKYSMLMTEGNLNSEIGLPLMALRLQPDTQLLLLEMGIDHVGEMENLVDVFKPEYGVITFIGTAHIGKFGSQAIIAAEKGKIFSQFSESSSAFVSCRDALAIHEKTKWPGKLSLYGEGIDELQVEDSGLEGWRFTYQNETFQFPLCGIYNLQNFYAAAAVALALGFQVKEILQGGAQVEPLFGRGMIKMLAVEGGMITLIEDCYNANGESVASAIEFISTLKWSGRKMLALGSMKELGDESVALHQAVGLQIAKSNIDVVFLLGEETQYTFDALSAGGFAGEAFFMDSMDLMLDEVQSHLQSDDIWLLKGSRSMQMEKLESVMGTVTS